MMLQRSAHRPLPRVPRVALVLVASFTLTPLAAQATPDDNWWGGFAAPPSGQGVSDPSFAQVTALGSFGTDLIAGGDFSSAGFAPALRVARWSGSNWSTFGQGFDAAPLAFVLHDGTLYAGGYFTHSGTTPVNYVARWTGSVWEQVGTGFDGYVKALVVYEGTLVAAGAFTHAGPVATGRIARWDGANWTSLGAFDDRIEALAVWDGLLIAGGIFDAVDGVGAPNVAVRNGTTWEALGGGTNGRVRSLAVHQGDLIAAGRFTTAGSAAALNVARFDGTTWSSLGSGVNEEVFALAPYRKNLIVAGKFSVAGGGSASRIARWDGGTWSSLGTGLDGTVAALRQEDDALYVGGVFTAAGAKPSSRIARWLDDPTPRIGYVIDPGGSGDFPTLQSGLDAAADGDTLSILPGVYPDPLTVRGKWLHLLGLGAPEPPILHSLTWLGGTAPPGERVLVRGVSMTNAVSVTEIVGWIALEQCDFQSPLTANGTGYPNNGQLALRGSSVEAGADLRYDGANVGLLVDGVHASGGLVSALCEQHAEVAHSTFEACSLFVSASDYVALRESSFLGTGAAALVDGDDLVIVRNRLEEAGTLTIAPYFNATVQENQLQNARGIVVRDGMGWSIRRNLIVGGTVGITAHSGSSGSASENTIVDCTGSAILVGGSNAYVDLARNILCGNQVGVTKLAGASAVFASCNDVWGNLGGNWVGLPDPTGSEGNLSEDPRFCNPTFGDYTLMVDSPCAPAQQPVCGRIGAYDVGCGVSTAVEDAAALDRLVLRAPNPLRPGAPIVVEGGGVGHVVLSLFDLGGRRIAVLPTTSGPGGDAVARWSGSRAEGQVSNGVYFLRAERGEQRATRTVLLLH
ncbi:MAG: right-handed parallel beta-helix repeat-containing protein [Candidatus Eisenbacteria bacterium]|nr:right-handed parallel beta-helix repeat-containing protein [Candidatus Eisenbacteria bacterium]